MKKDILQQLRALKEKESQIQPDALWVQQNKKRLLSQIQNTTAADTKSAFSLRLWQLLEIFIPHNTVIVAQRFAVFILIIGVAVGGFSLSASASQNSLPGDKLWKIKLATEAIEDVAVFTVADSQTKVALKKKRVEKRVEELEKLTQERKDDLPKRIKEANVVLKENLTAASEIAGQVQSEHAVKIALELTQTNKQAKDALKKATEAIVENASTEQEKKEVEKDVKATTKEINQTNLEVIKKAVQKRIKGGNEVEIEEEEEIKKVVMESVEELSDQQSQDKAKDVIEKAKQTTTHEENEKIETPSTTAKQSEEVNIESSSSTLQTTSTSLDLVTTTPDQKVKEEAAPAPAPNVQKVIADAQRGTNEVEQLRNEVKTLANSNQLIEAIERAQDLGEVASKTEAKIEQLEQLVGTNQQPKKEEVPKETITQENTEQTKETSTVQVNSTTKTEIAH
ncbi:hypothetical protein H6758_04195 [Candidatus Nomurabacteria bacterium]|nr:hypothetical protein [Candidatus Nomurabacteria bacterium]